MIGIHRGKCCFEMKDFVIQQMAKVVCCLSVGGVFISESYGQQHLSFGDRFLAGEFIRKTLASRNTPTVIINRTLALPFGFTLIFPNIIKFLFHFSIKGSRYFYGTFINSFFYFIV